MLLFLLACGTPDTSITATGDDTGGADGAPVAEIDPTELVWTDVDVGYSFVQDLTVRNVGVGDLTVYQIDLLSDTGDAYIFDQVQNAVIPAGAEQSWPVTCDLPTAETATASMRVRTDDPAAAEVQVPCTCTPAAG